MSSFIRLYFNQNSFLESDKLKFSNDTDILQYVISEMKNSNDLMCSDSESMDSTKL